MTDNTERWLVDATGWRGPAARPEVHKIAKETEKTFTIKDASWGNRTRRISKGAFMVAANSEAEARQIDAAYRDAYESFEPRIDALRDQLRREKQAQEAACLKALGIERRESHD